jgi:hypothetical protein
MRGLSIKILRISPFILPASGHTLDVRRRTPKCARGLEWQAEADARA